MIIGRYGGDAPGTAVVAVGKADEGPGEPPVAHKQHTNHPHQKQQQKYYAKANASRWTAGLHPVIGWKAIIC